MFVRGQTQTPDFVFASTVFFAALLVVLIFWTTSAGRILAAGEAEGMAAAGLRVADQLLATGGSPSNWSAGELGGVSSLGIADSYGVINEGKLARLAELNATNYDDVRELLSAGAYELYAKAELQNGTGLYEFGKLPERNLTDVRANSVDRLALLNGSVVNFKVMVWR